MDFITAACVATAMQQHTERQPILDRCPYCKLPVQPGEVHGEIRLPECVGGTVTDGLQFSLPKVVCRIKKLAYVEDVIETPAPEGA